MIDLIGQAIIEGAIAGLGLGAKVVAANARTKAPVRSIFSDGGYHIRFKSIDEIQGDRVIRASLGLGPERTRGPQRARTTLGRSIGGTYEPQYQAPRHWRERRLAEANRLLAEYDAEITRRQSLAGYVPQKTALSRRGASEVRSKRAQFTTWGHSAIGGRLRASISASPPRIGANGAEAWVIATAPYAKYMEFGTRHNAAHPFLRPAAAESRAEVVRLIADGVKEGIRTGASSTEIEIVVRI